MGFLDNTGVARLWQHILVKVNERLTVDPSVTEEGAANLINADSLGGILAKDYATKADIDAIDILVADPTLTQEGLAAESKTTGTRIAEIGDRVTVVENNKVESVNGLTGKNITLDVGTMGAVLKTGDTMTGALALQGAGIQFLSEDTALLGCIAISSTSKNIRFHQIYSPNEPYEYYALPAASKVSGSSNVLYNILTSKNPVTIAQGGTGATDAATARTNLGVTPQNIGALPLTGGTLTGQLSAESLAIRTGGEYPQLQYYPAGLTECSGKVQQNNGNRSFLFMEYHSDQDTASTRYCEQYSLPAPDAGLTANKTYYILTSKAAVTIPQGGTGATDVSNARKNLLVTSLKTTDAATTALVQGIQVSELPSTANGTQDPQGGVLLTAATSNNRGVQIANGYAADSLKWRFIHSNQTSNAGTTGYSSWHTIYHSGNISTLMTEITSRLTNANGVSF